MSASEKQPLLEQQQTQAERDLSLGELQQNVFKAQRAYMRAWSRSTSGKWHKRIMFGVTALILLFVVFCFGVIADDVLNDEEWHYPQRIPLEAHIMSKCPDAKDCLHEIILPTMQNVSRKVDFKLSYIGNITHDDDGVSCKHGPSECLGNILELCAAHLYPDPKIYLGFTMCMTRQYEEIASRELVEDCALEHGVSMARLDACAVQDDGGLAVGMLQQSFNRTANAGVAKSCTIRLNDTVWCVRDDGQWKDCEHGHTAADLSDEIVRLYDAQWEQ